jgi:hypothetical protein
MFIARDKDGTLCAYNEKPWKDVERGIYEPSNKSELIGRVDPYWFPRLTFEDGPRELEIMCPLTEFEKSQI